MFNYFDPENGFVFSADELETAGRGSAGLSDLDLYLSENWSLISGAMDPEIEKSVFRDLGVSCEKAAFLKEYSFRHACAFSVPFDFGGVLFVW